MILRQGIIFLFLLNINYLRSEEVCAEIKNCNTCSNPGPICLACNGDKLMSKDKMKCLCKFYIVFLFLCFVTL